MNSVNKQNRERVISDWVFYSQSTSMVISGRWRRDRQTHRQTDRDRDRQTETETDRDTDRQIDRQTDRQTETHAGVILIVAAKCSDRYIIQSLPSPPRHPPRPSTTSTGP